MNGGSSASYLACAPCVLLCLIGVEPEGLLDYQGRARIISVVWWNLCLVIFGADVLGWGTGRKRPSRRPGGGVENRGRVSEEQAGRGEAKH